MRQAVFFLGLAALMLTLSCTKSVRPDSPSYPDASLEEILFLYREQREILPPLKGLMEVIIGDTAYQRFWAKWRSRPGTIQIEGFNLLGGTLFQFQLEDARVSLNTEEDRFHGSREAFKEYLIAQTPDAVRLEWLTLFDWIARAGVPDLALPHRPVLEKQDNQFVLYFFETRESRAMLTQKLFIERKTFRVTEAAFFEPEGSIRAKIKFGDYRPLHNTLFPFSIKTEVQGKTVEIAFKELGADDPHVPTRGATSNDDFGY